MDVKYITWALGFHIYDKHMDNQSATRTGSNLANK